VEVHSMYSYTTYHRVRDMVPTSDDNVRCSGIFSWHLLRR